MFLIKFESHICSKSNLELPMSARPGRAIRCEGVSSGSCLTEPSHLISAAIGDIDGDGRLDIVIYGMFGFPPFDRMGRVTLWKNQTARKRPSS